MAGIKGDRQHSMATEHRDAQLRIDLATKRRGYSSARWPDYHKRDYKKQALDWYWYGPVKRVPEGCINAPPAVDVPAVAAVTVAAVPAVVVGAPAFDGTGREIMPA